jgi:arsenate reductase
MTDTTPRPSWATLPLDQATVLNSAAIRLSDEFRGVFGPETVERFLHTSFDQFATRGTVPQFLLLMAERFALQRLQGLAKWSDSLIRRGSGRQVVVGLLVGGEAVE